MKVNFTDSFKAEVASIHNLIVGIPGFRWYGTEAEYNIMVIDLLGSSLENMLVYCKYKFSLKTVLLLAYQMLQRVEYIHSKSFLHRDIKPDNFLIGKRKKHWLLYMIDYGLAKRYRDPRTGEHIKYRDRKNLTGTARYTSLNTHLGIEQSRRDDIEGIAYSLIYFLRGSLPWQGLPAKTKKEKYEKIKELKLSIKIEVLCKGLPTEFAVFLSYCRALAFDEEPNYEYIHKLFNNLYEKKGYDKDCIYDWTIMHTASKSLIGTKGSFALLQGTECEEQNEGVLEIIEDEDKPQLVKPTNIKPRISTNKLIFKASTVTQRGTANSTPDKVRMRDIVNICDKVPF